MRKISVIVPVYNAEKTLRRCVDSILIQTYSNFELILVDDGSQDHSGLICDDYVKIDERVVVVHKENGGPSSSRNKGLNTCSGEYVCFVDADDWVEERYIESFFHSEINVEKALVIQDLVKELPQKTYLDIGLKEDIIHSSQFERLFADLKITCYGYPVAKLYDIQIIRKNSILFNEKVRYGEDLLFMLNYLLYAQTVYTFPFANYHYVITDIQNLSYSYYSYETEIFCFEAMKEAMTRLFERHNLTHLNGTVLFPSISFYFVRSLQSFYRPKYKKKYQKRMDIIRLLWTRENIQCLVAWGKGSKVRAIPVFLYSNRFFFLFDIYSNISFYIRYKFAYLWKQFGHKLSS